MLNTSITEMRNRLIIPANQAFAGSMEDAVEIDITGFLKQELQEHFIFFRNSGNAGDALMAVATDRLFEKLGLNFTQVDLAALSDTESLSNEVVVLSGGGNFSEGGYNTYAGILRRIHTVAKQVIVLPHTIHGNIALLSQLEDNVTLICRERVSYQHCRRHAAKAKVYLAHDMAFLLEVEAALAFTPRYLGSMATKMALSIVGSEKASLYPTFKSYLSGMKSLLQTSVGRASGGKKIANLYRYDMEKSAIDIPEDNVDASLSFNYGVTSPLKASFTGYHLLRFLDSYDVINTNRLHVAIAGALLGKQVNFSSNSYFKCRAVFDHSLAGSFPKVKWVEEP